MEFVVTPDHPAAARSAASLIADGASVLRHASGRPWIVGWWGEDDIVTAAAGDTRVAILGRTTLDSAALERELRGLRTDADLDRLAKRLPGCFHLVSSLAGTVRAQGSVAGVYQIHYARINGVTVAADRPDRLITWTGASLDHDLLPLWLLVPYGPPWPLNLRSLWRGVQVVTPGHYLRIDRAGAAQTTRWWSPPVPELSRSEGAERVRSALVDSVRARVGHSGSTRLSADLSGGMDSTGLCYLAHHLTIPITTVHYAFSDRSNPDSHWAQRAQRDLDSARHLVFRTAALPGFFTDPLEPGSGPGLEGPANLVPRSVVEQLAGAVAEAGASRHLQGHGADGLFTPDLAVVKALARRHPWRWLRSMQARKARARLGLTTALRQFRSPGAYHRWLRRASQRLMADGRALKQDGGWEISPQPPEWATPDAVAQIRELIRAAAAAHPAPFAPRPEQHALLRGLQIGGQLVRQSTLVGERFGVSFESPYLDDRVVEAAMSIRLEERFQTKVNKPVLAAAMRGVMPPEALDRNDKSNGDRELFDGVRRSRHRLEEVLADPLLARLGLVDADRLRQVVLGLQASVDRLAQLEPTWACEIWLRTQAGTNDPTAAAARPLAPVAG